MAGFQERVRTSLQVRLSLTLSVAILVVAVVAGAFSFMTAFDEADELQDDVLRQVAANCRTEQRRCLIFRDKCINRPLPHESMRSLLNDISVTTRDQLTAFFDFNNAAAKLERIINTIEPQPEPDKRVMGRRQLFTSIFSKLPKG